MVRKHHHGCQRPGAKSQHLHAATPDPKQAARGLARTAHGPDPASRAPAPPIHALEQPAHARNHPAYGREQSLHGLEQSVRVLEYSAFVLVHPTFDPVRTMVVTDQPMCALVQSSFVPVRLPCAWVRLLDSPWSEPKLPGRLALCPFPLPFRTQPETITSPARPCLGPTRHR
uniref:Uncharacterized protein n=1 Tax=Candidatus Kentrum sp. LFY TaxID=2126342 RepID=A0A450UKV6_9GAMM|nr:MAG: hypothetical protein BECKLFY1418B_GA0070995_104221 [Candidatus Kentron sp. LFY]